jgi:hypothetical protein
MSRCTNHLIAKAHATWRDAVRHLAPRSDAFASSDQDSRTFAGTSSIAAPEADRGPRSHRATHGRGQPHPYFVGRRPDEAAEVYAVTETDVRRLDREWRDGSPSLDWRDQDASALQLSRMLLARVTGMPPPRHLAEQFVLTVLADLPDDGFVLGSDEVWRWLQTVNAPHAVARAKPRGESRLARLSAGLRRSGAR